tara:strand:+ start:262 stop:1980 length:1719 start_codon:yes stop_codon:yes gene_type:complete
MAYNILGIHPGHNSSAALISDGKLVYFLEEERLSRAKRDANPYRVIINICSKYKIDEIVIGGTNDPTERHVLPWGDYSSYEALVLKHNPKVTCYWANEQHHFLHSYQSFYNSGFKNAIGIVVDGSGTCKTLEVEHKEQHKPATLLEVYEIESIFQFSPSSSEILYTKCGTNASLSGISKNIHVTKSPGIAKTYEAITQYLGWQELEAGKTMGLSSYGSFNKDIPPLFFNGSGDCNYFNNFYPASSTLDTLNIPSIPPPSSNEWHKDSNKVTQLQKDLAWRVQKDTQEEVAKLIENTIKETGIKQICCSGGYFLNCVTNYYLKKRFPDVDFYFEPVANDAGTAIGAALLRWHDHSKNNIKSKKQTSIYLGPKYSNKKILKKILKFKNMFNTYKITPEQVAKLISERNIVTIFQGRSEAGPRALGNRSILYDPTDPNGKDFVNKVKNREWFRPFAGTVLLERAHEYFDMAGLEESPFMMYAMDVWPDKQEEIKAITHVDGTCRIQTVTQEQNPHYYKLIQEFEKITGTPILFNTSFNLAGDPLVETIEDALETMLKSEMKYMYVPELEMLLEKK